MKFKLYEAEPHTLIIYTDGGARGNPGPAAVGAVIQDASGKMLKEYSHYLGERTNNEAEYEAVILALKKAKQLFGKGKTKEMAVHFRVDSELIARQLMGRYKVEEERLAQLFMKVWNLKMDFGSVDFESIPREKNRAADRLVNRELDRQETKLF
ncbi:MAG: ribonuclease HI family protein [Candidatus Niyogibacteria bacterium]|nr:ribonuclease HI family protein [Candidatus Niyogibacteria bacterium]